MTVKNKTSNNGKKEEPESEPDAEVVVSSAKMIAMVVPVQIWNVVVQTLLHQPMDQVEPLIGTIRQAAAAGTLRQVEIDAVEP